MLSLSLWSLVAVLRSVEVTAFGARVSPHLPARGLAVYTWVVVALNALVWLRAVVPATFAERPTAVLDGTGLTTNPVYVQDLAVWLPLAAAAGVWAWRRLSWGYLALGAVLVFWVVESVGVAVDQWLGAAADPSSAVASSAGSVLFAVSAVVGLVPLALHLRALDRPAPSVSARYGSAVPSAG
jgi:hypothetical protein